MPWEYPDNVPTSMQHFKPEIQQKAIAIANAIVKSGGKDGTAIATGIKKAKEMSKAGLIKMAVNYAARGAGVGLGVGAIIGGAMGSRTNIVGFKNGKPVRSKNSSTFARTVAGGLAGGLVGASLGTTIGRLKNSNAKYKYNNSPGFNTSNFSSSHQSTNASSSSSFYESFESKYAKRKKEAQDRARKRWKEDYGWNHDTGDFDHEHHFWKEHKYRDHYGSGHTFDETWDGAYDHNFEEKFYKTKDSFRDSFRKKRDQDDFEDFFKRFTGSNGNKDRQYTPPPPPAPKRSTAGHESFFKEYNIDHSGITTKKEAKAHYRKLARDFHPDTTSNPQHKDGNAFKKMQQHWEDVENSTWFTKLASLGLLKLAVLQGGPHSNLPNAWQTMGKGVGVGQRQDIPLAKGLPKIKPVNFQVQ